VVQSPRQYFRPAHTALIVVRKQDMNEYFMLVKSLYLDSDDGRQRSDQYTILLKFPSAEVGERYREKFRKGRGGDSHVLTEYARNCWGSAAYVVVMVADRNWRPGV